MKEKDLNKCLDNLIIKGLIQEAEQDNAEFETAMREISDEDFLGLIYDTVDEPIAASMNMEKEVFLKDTVIPSAPRRITLRKANHVSDEWKEWDTPAPSNKHKAQKSGNKVWKIWAGAIASVAAILLIVFIPAYREMNSRLCDSALLASETYMGPSRGIDIYSLENNEVKDMLPELEQQYAESIRQRLNPQEAGMDLLQAYLKLGEKDKAVDVLHKLEANIDDPDFQDYCKKMLEILE